MDPRVVVLPDRALTTEVQAKRATISSLKKVGFNLVPPPSEALHTLQDGVIAELWAREQRALNVISKQKVNNAQMFIEKTSAISLLNNITKKNEFTTAMVAKADRTVMELNIPEHAPVNARSRKLTAGVEVARWSGVSGGR